MRESKTTWRQLLMLVSLAVGLVLGARVMPAQDGPGMEFPFKDRQTVLFFGDSIVAPGMYSYVVNSLLDRVHPGHGLTFSSWGQAGATAESILPRVPEVLKGKTYDWVLLNFAHNDCCRYSADEFLSTHAPSLLAEVRKYHKGRIGWLSILGSEPSPYAGKPNRVKADACIAETRAKQGQYAEAVKALCHEQGLLYVPLHEAMSRLLAERERQNLKICFTMDHVHPNLLGNWIVGGLLLQAMGLDPAPLTVDVLQSDAYTAQGSRDVTPPAQPQMLDFAGLFLKVRLIPPAERVVTADPVAAPVVVDGAPSEWPPDLKAYRIAPPLNVTWELVPRSSTAGYAATLRACHNAQMLYLLFDVTEPNTGQGKWFDELIEVLIDARKDRSRSGNVWRHTPGLTQFLFSRDFTGGVPGNAKAWANGDTSQGDGLKAAARRTEHGYVLEAAIPLANFKQVDITKTDGAPLDWALSFTDQTFNLDWQGLMSRSGSTFGYGTLRLGGPGAAVVFTDPGSTVTLAGTNAAAVRRTP